MSRSQQPHKRFLMRLYWNNWRIQPKTSNEALNGMLRQASRVAGQSLSGCARRWGLLSSVPMAASEANLFFFLSVRAHRRRAKASSQKFVYTVPAEHNDHDPQS